MNKALVITGFVAALVGVGILAGSVTPVAYGVGEADAKVMSAGIFGGLLSAGGVLTSIYQMFFKGGSTDLLKKIEELGSTFISKPQTVETVTTEVALVALFAIAAKGNDMANLAKISDLAASMLAKK